MHPDLVGRQGTGLVRDDDDAEGDLVQVSDRGGVGQREERGDNAAGQIVCRHQGHHDLKEEARTAAIAAMRGFAGRCIRPDLKMDTARKEALGVIPCDTTPTPVPVPEKGPTDRVITRADLPGMAKVYTAAKPCGVVSIEAACPPSRLELIDSRLGQ
jgi:hypothetical protein